MNPNSPNPTPEMPAQPTPPVPPSEEPVGTFSPYSTPPQPVSLVPSQPSVSPTTVSAPVQSPADQPLELATGPENSSVPSSESPERGTKKIILIGIIASVVIVVLSVVAWLILRQPGEADFGYIKDTAIKNLQAAEKQLGPTTDAYFTTYRTVHDESGVAAQAEDRARKDYDAFQRAESAYRSAITALDESRAANDSETGQAVDLLVDVSTERADYYASLVDFYPQFERTFRGKDNKVCADIFIGETSSFTDRKERLNKAASDCYDALDELKKSSNPTYRDFALKVEKRLKLLESDAAAVVETEKKNQTFLTKEQEYKQRQADATARGASSQELEKLAAEIKKTSSDIKDNNADLSYAGDRYIKTVKEFPELFKATFATDAAKKVESFKSRSKVRVKTLQLIVEDKVRLAS